MKARVRDSTKLNVQCLLGVLGGLELKKLMAFNVYLTPTRMINWKSDIWYPVLRYTAVIGPANIPVGNCQPSWKNLARWWSLNIVGLTK